MSEYIIREVRITDAKRLVEIYAPYILETAVSFEYHVPDIEEFENRIREYTKKYPYLFCEKDGQVLGYAYASAYSTREAYDWTAMTSIYIDKDCRREGVGAMLYR